MKVAAAGSEPPRPVGVPDGREAAYSPDGKMIAFSAGRYAPDHRIFTTRLDGTGRVKLTDPEKGPHRFPSGGCFRPAFTPDGKRLIFFLESWPDGPTGTAKENLWIMDMDKGHAKEVADYGLFDDPLRWKPRRLVPARAP
jgi:Tol biopolymer transport system component